MAQLSSEQRYTISALIKEGFCQSLIAQRLNVHRSTISRELGRNSSSGSYQADAAQRRTDKRKRNRTAYKFDAAMQTRLNEWIRKDYSPEQIWGRMRLEGVAMVSPEWIYQYIYRDKRNGGDLYTHLREKHKKRRKRLNTKDRRGIIPDKVMIADRPKIVDAKQRMGDFEGDTIIGKNHQGAIVTLVCRQSKYTLMAKVEHRTAENVEAAIVKLLSESKIKAQTLTFDNGKEFSNHKQIAERLGVAVYFANPYHSWERGLNENTNGLIRQYIPKSQDLTPYDEHKIQHIQDTLNNRPRKTLKFISPNEFIAKNYP